MNKEVILSLSCTGHDTAASLMIDGKLVACCEQERYTHDKHSRRFPIDAVNDCLKIGGVTMADVDEIAIPEEPMRSIRELFLENAIKNDKRVGFLLNDIEIIRFLYNMEDEIRKQTEFEGPIRFLKHHLCHLACAYYPSGFEETLLASYDGMGESDTAMLGIGRGGEIKEVHNANRYPNSLGLLYAAITWYLGWQYTCDEGIIMGLACYGDAYAEIPGQNGMTYYDVFAECLKETGDYDFEVVQGDWLNFYEARSVWVGDKFKEILGPKRDYDDELTQHHKNIAAGLQQRLEDLVVAQLKRARKEFGMNKLAITGGVALNCSMNGRILAEGIFDEIFIPPASGDPGTTVGACYLTRKLRGNEVVPEKMHNFYGGTRATKEEVRKVLDESELAYTEPNDLYAHIAERMEQGRIVGWYQGGAEFGPRALGNRSILCSPFPASQKDHINARVKFREEFRPFAPAVMWEHTKDYFLLEQESPHMLMAVQANPENMDKIPAVLHVDNSCRTQTVKPENNERFYKLITAFYERTGVPVVLNTSFNIKGQPIVNTPEEAVNSFRTTNIDVLVVGDFVLEKDGDKLPLK